MIKLVSSEPKKGSKRFKTCVSFDNREKWCRSRDFSGTMEIWNSNAQCDGAHIQISNPGYTSSLHCFLKFCKKMYPGTYVNDMHLLAMALQEPASPNEPMIIQFCTYMYAYEDLKDPDDFQVFLLHFTRTCTYLCFNSFITSVHSTLACTCCEFFAAFAWSSSNAGIWTTPILCHSRMH